MGRKPGWGVWRWAVAWLATAAGLIAAPSAQASFDCGTAMMHCQVQIDNSGRVWFGSPEKLTEDALGDGTLKGGVFQVYERTGNETLLVSRMPNGEPIPAENKQHVAAMLQGVSPDGSRVYMDTDASLTPNDLDSGHEGASSDGYLLSGGQYTLLTTGPLEGGSNENGYPGMHTLWASDDGRYVYFETGQRLVPEDWDNGSDIYQRFEGQTRLVSTGPDEFLPTEEWPHPFVPDTRFLGASPDGSTAYFATSQHLTVGDSGKSPSEARFMTPDIFAWHDGVTTRLTRTVSPEEVPGTPWEVFDPYSFAGAADEGSVYFVARSAQVPEDTNQMPDIYRAKPDGTLEQVIASGIEGSDRALRVEAVSRDGSRIFLSRPRWLNAAKELELDEGIFMWSGGKYESLVPPSRTPVTDAELALCSISGDGKRAYFQTRATLSPEDTDSEPDVYEWHEGDIRLVSPASDGRQTAAFCSGISPNGRYVAFTTWEQLVPGDNDVNADIYVVDMGAAGGAAASGARARTASASGVRSRRASHRGHRSRPRLVTAEAIAPRMTVGPTGAVGKGVARLRLGCPKVERSGPCHGRVKLLAASGHRVLATGTFRIATGHGSAVVLTGAALPQRGFRALARVRGADMLGNTRTVTAAVSLHRGG